MGRRRLYVPITRSGSSIIASILTQLLDAQRRQRHQEIDRMVYRGELSEGLGLFLKHPFAWCITGFGLVVIFMVIIAFITD